MSNPAHGKPPNSMGSSSASSPTSVSLQTGSTGNSSSSSTSSYSSSSAYSSSLGGGILKDKAGLPPVYLNLNDNAKDQTPGGPGSPLQNWDDARTADVWLSSLHSVIFIITCALAAFILFRNVLTW